MHLMCGIAQIACFHHHMLLLASMPSAAEPALMQFGPACRGSELVHSVPDDIYGAVPAAAEFESWAQTRWEVSCASA